MSKRSRTTGNREERDLAAQLPGARKISRSGYTGPDIEWHGRTIEAKYRGDGFITIYRYIEDVEILAIRRKREPWLMVMTIDVLLDLIEEGGNGTRDEKGTPTMTDPHRYPQR